ncbi:MAG: hypothetical protein GXN95_07285 [Methanococci archaeon]|nr:hypothetical protein [Methanococci archaeon]
MSNYLKKIFEDLEPEEKIILYALGALNNTPLNSKIKLHKLLFLVSNVFPQLNKLLEFEEHFLGPYSEKINYILDDLISLGLVEKKGGKYKLTEKGMEIYKRLKPKPELKEVLEDFKEFIHDLTDDEILAFIYVSYPKYTKESIKWDELKKRRVDLAISLLKKQKVSFGKAAQIAGLSPIEFEELLLKRGIKWREI